MATPSWTDYVGATAGIVGMVTGIFGAITGYLGYRRSNQLKALDMRLTLRKDLSEARDSVTTVRELMTSAEGSRRATLAARGLYKSGQMVVWERTLATDREEVARFAAGIPSEGTDFSALSEAQLETYLVAAHKTKSSLSSLIEKYRGELAEDSDSRRQIADQVTATTAARISRNP